MSTHVEPASKICLRKAHKSSIINHLENWDVPKTVKYTPYFRKFTNSEY